MVGVGCATRPPRIAGRSDRALPVGRQPRRATVAAGQRPRRTGPYDDSLPFEPCQRRQRVGAVPRQRPAVDLGELAERIDDDARGLLVADGRLGADGAQSPLLVPFPAAAEPRGVLADAATGLVVAVLRRASVRVAAPGQLRGGIVLVGDRPGGRRLALESPAGVVGERERFGRRVRRNQLAGRVVVVPAAITVDGARDDAAGRVALEQRRTPRGTRVEFVLGEVTVLEAPVGAHPVCPRREQPPGRIALELDRAE